MPKFRAVRANPLKTVTIEAYVPNRDRDGRLVHNHESWVQQVEAVLARLSGGGATTYKARGYWRGSYEATTVVRAAVLADEGRPGETLAQTLGAFASETNQELAGFTVDGVWYYAAPQEATV
jgi:hypothetical protein